MTAKASFLCARHFIISFFFIAFYSFNSLGCNFSLKPQSTVSDSAISEYIKAIYENDIEVLPLIEALECLKKFDNAIEKQYDITPTIKERLFLNRGNLYFHNDKVDQGESVLLEGSKYFEEENLPIQRCNLLIRLGSHFLGRKNYPKAFEYLFKLEDVLNQIGYENYPDVSRFMEYISYACIQFNDLDKAEYYTDLAFNLPFTSYRSEINIYNNKALILKAKNDTNASLYFEKALDIATEEKDTAWMGILSGNLAYYYLLKKEFAIAESLLITDTIYSKQTGQYNSIWSSQLGLVSVFLSQQKNQEAFELLMQLKKKPTIQKKTNLTHLKDYYRFLAKYYENTGNFELAIRYADSMNTVKDSIYLSNEYLRIQQLEDKINTEKHLAEVKFLDEKYEHEVRLRNTIIFSSAAGLFLLGILYWQYRLKRNKEKQMLLLRENHTQELLSNSQDQLEKYISNVKEKNKLIDQFKADLEGLKLSKEDKKEAKRDEIRGQLFEQSLLTDEDWSEFKRLFEKVHPGYLQRLDEKFPQLTFAETRLFVLHKLELSTKEMASMMGISPSSVRKTQLRLRKKLEIVEQTDFTKLAQEI
ncbi:MAG: hypothetical protein CL843_00255 [Crocinitomicaceae bacterium]|nr:hypothetical protein [Crocinitomicaceae bacterium]|tara:strand:- start:6730 stop:8493 length:1764 start_codon:yes stop_codon:yes gene_type:complete